MKQKIILFGASGLLGSHLILQLKKKYKFYYVYNNNCNYFENVKYIKIPNIASEASFTVIQNIISKIQPQIVINCLALANIGECEKDKELSKKINFEFPVFLSKLSKIDKFRFLQISTDQVYSFLKKSTVTEKSEAIPKNIYGYHKLLADQAISKMLKKYIIIRTNFFGISVFSEKFTEEVLNTIYSKKKNYFFSNYFYKPIYVKYLCIYIEKILSKSCYGIFNIVGDQLISKYDFAKKILDNTEHKKSIFKKISPKSFSKLRYKFLDLSNKKIKNVTKTKIPSIDNQIIEFLNDKEKINKFINKKMYYSQHFTSKEDAKAVFNVIINKPLTQGDEVDRLEDKICRYVDCKYAVVVSSCTAGLHLSYLASGVNKNNNVLTSPLTFVSTANAALFCQSNVLFSDINAETLSLDVKEIPKQYFKKNIKVVVPVHFAGLASHMKKVKKIFNDKIIIEDAAHAFGAKYECGSMVGSCKYSDIAVFSFHPVKIIAGGEGGAITTNSYKIYKDLLELRSHGIDKINFTISDKVNGYTDGKPNLWWYEMKKIGFHYRQTDIHSSLISSQMLKIDLFLEQRRKIANIYDHNFRNNNYIDLTQAKTRDYSSNHIYVIRIKFNKLKISRNEFMIKLRNKNIYSQVHYIPVPLQNYYKKKYNINCQKYLPNTMEYYNECLSIPIYYGLNFKMQKYVIDSINEIIKNNY